MLKKNYLNYLLQLKERLGILSEIWGMKKYDSLISLYDDSFTSKELEYFFDDIGNFIKKDKSYYKKTKEKVEKLDLYHR